MHWRFAANDGKEIYMNKMFDLQLFDEGAPPANAGPAAEGESGNTPPAEKNEQAQPEGEQAAAQQEENPDAEFEQLIKTKFKKQFGKKTEALVAAQRKDKETLEKQHGALLDRLYLRYGVNDTAALEKALDEDKAWIEAQAVQKGISTEQLLRSRQLELENERFRRAQQEQQEKAHREQVLAEWMRQGEAVRQMFPGFDFETELANDNFAGLLSKGIDVMTAYKVCHFDDIQAGTIEAAVHDTQRRVTEDIKARGTRPVENAAGTPAAVRGKLDIKNSTKAQRDDWERRILDGEKLF